LSDIVRHGASVPLAGFAEAVDKMVSIGVDRIARPDRYDGEIRGARAIARGGENEYNHGRNRRTPGKFPVERFDGRRHS